MMHTIVDTRNIIQRPGLQRKIQAKMLRKHRDYLFTMSFSRGKVASTAVTVLKPWLITITNKKPFLPM